MRKGINPVLRKEYLTKMRGWKAAGMLGGYLAVLALFACMVLYNMYGNVMYSTLDSNATVTIYSSLAVLQFALLLFVTPALTAGSISGEREKQTLELLISTKLRPFSIILGKLLSALSHVFYLILASIPIYSIVFLFGGISMLDLLALFGYFMMTVILISSIGIFYSAFFKKTTAATVLTYLTVGAITLGTLVAAAFYLGIFYTNGNNYNGILPILHTNPAAGFADILRIQLSGNSMSIPGMSVDPNAKGPTVTPWLGNIIFDVVCVLLLLFAATRKIDPLKERRTKVWLNPEKKEKATKIKKNGKQNENESIKKDGDKTEEQGA